MAEKVLFNQLAPGVIVYPPDGVVEDWKPFDFCNDFYPKIVTPVSNTNLDYSIFTIYEQKSAFRNKTFPPNNMVIEPTVAGWGITFQNIVLTLNKEKYVIFNEAKENKNVKFDDTFYRFSSMYTFEDKIDATSEGKLPFLIKSWKYKK